jgi:predicted transcriptional regulator
LRKLDRSLHISDAELRARRRISGMCADFRPPARNRSTGFDFDTLLPPIGNLVRVASAVRTLAHELRRSPPEVHCRVMEPVDLPREFRRHRVEMLACARNSPVVVTPDAPIAEAVTTMLANDFSQVPVMQSERDLKGLKSWKSLGRRQSLGQACERARDVMDRVDVVSIHDSLFEVIPVIARHDCVLVRDERRVITGIVTAFDVCAQLQAFAEPFWRLEDLETYLRAILESCVTRSDLDLLDQARARSKMFGATRHDSRSAWVGRSLP